MKTLLDILKKQKKNKDKPEQFQLKGQRWKILELSLY